MDRKVCALYLRLSDDKRNTGENVADQERGARWVAETKGFVVHDVYSDNSCPASDPERHPRPQFERLLLDAQAGLFDAVIVRHVDRLYRHPSDQLRVSNVFGSRGITVHQEWSGYPLDLSTATGVLNAGIAAQVALYEIQHKRERQTAMNQALLRAGRPSLGGPRPFGFNRDMTPHETEATEIAEATERLLRGGSLGSIIRDWNQRGIKAPRGGLWGYTSVRAVLLRWSNAGIRQMTVTDLHSGRRVVVESGPGTWQGIVSEADFRALRALLSDEARIKHRGDVGRKHLLSHILKCGKCGAAMRAARTRTRAGQDYLTYQCSGQGCRLAVDYSVAEECVLRAVIRRLAMPSPGMLSLTLNEREQAATTHRRLREIDRDELAIEGARISRASRLRQLQVLQTERESLQTALTTITKRMALAGLLAEQIPLVVRGKASIPRSVRARQQAEMRFSALDLHGRREVIRALLVVTVDPSPKGVRPTKATAAQRICIVPLDPATGEIERESEFEAGLPE